MQLILIYELIYYYYYIIKYGVIILCIAKYIRTQKQFIEKLEITSGKDIIDTKFEHNQSMAYFFLDE